MRARSGLAVVLLWVCGRAAGVSLPFDRIVVFGDSWSDSGGQYGGYAVTGGAIPGPGYFEEKMASNGPIWPLQLAAALDVELLSHAVAGSTSDYEAFVPGGAYYLPGVVQQVALYLANETERAHMSSSLHIIQSGGINELIISPFIQAPSVAARLSAAVDMLTAAGAGMLLFGVEPSLRWLPYSAGRATPKWLEEYDRYASQMKHSIVGIAQRLPSNTTAGVLDLRVMFDSIHRNATAWGFNESFVHPAVPCGSGLGFGAHGPFEPCANPDQALWWDTMHPTKATHALIAQAYVATIANLFAP